MNAIQYAYLGIILIVMMAIQELHNTIVQERLNTHYKHIDRLWEQNDENRKSINEIVEKLNENS